MGLNVTKPPAKGLQMVRKAVGQLITSEAGGHSPVARAASTHLNIAAPHPVYFVGLTDLAKGNLLSAAVLTGWRYILLEDDQTIGAATLRVGENEEQLQF